MAEIVIQRRRQRSVWPWLLGLMAFGLLPLPFLANDGDSARAARTAAARRDTAASRDTTAPRDTAPRTSGAVAGGQVAQGSGSRTTRSAAGAVAPGPPVATSAPAAGPSVGTPTRSAPTAASGTAAAPDRRTFEGVVAARRANLGDQEHREYTAEALRRLADEFGALGASRAGVRAIRVHADSLTMTRARSSARPDYARAAFLAAIREFDVLRGRYRATVDTEQLRSAAWSIRTDRPWLAQQATVDAFFQSARQAMQSLSRAAAERRRS